MFDAWFDSRANDRAALPRLCVPDPDAGCHPATLLRPAEWKDWLASLPNASAQASCRKLAAQLGRLARYPVAIPKLPAVLDVLEAPFARLVEQMDNLVRTELHTVEQRLFDEQTRAFAEANRELAHLQKRRVNATLDAGRTPPVGTLYAAMRTLARQLRLDLSGYHRTPPEPWRDMLSLYRITEFLELTRVRVEGSDADAPDVHTLFFGALLFQLADPLRLPHPQGWLLYEEALAAGALLDFVASDDGEATVPIDLDGSLPPLASARSLSNRPPQRVRYLPLAGVLRALEADAAAGGKPSPLFSLLRRLAEETRSGEGRRHVRVPHAAPYRMYAGLGAVHECLWRLARTRLPSSAAPSRVATLSHEGWSRQRKPVTGVACEQINQSQSGAAFLLAHSREAAVQIGDLVLFESATAKAEGRPMGFVARVRRLLLREGQEAVEIGVEKLPGRLLPVNIKGTPQVQQALLCQHGAGGELQLYGPVGGLHNGVTLELEGPASGFRVQVTEELERSRSSALVAVRRIDRSDLATAL